MSPLESVSRVLNLLSTVFFVFLLVGSLATAAVGQTAAITNIANSTFTTNILILVLLRNEHSLDATSELDDDVSDFAFNDE